MARTVNPAAHARRRSEIVAAAAVEFAAHGIDGTGTAAICRRASISSGTLFHYFPTKADMFHAVFADDLPRVTALCERATAEPDPDAGLDLLLDHLVDEVSDPIAPGLAAAAVLQANRDPAFAQLLGRIDATVLQALTTLLLRVQEGADRLVLPAPATARWIQTLIDASHLGGTGGPRDEVAAELRRIVAWLVGRDDADLPAR